MSKLLLNNASKSEPEAQHKPNVLCSVEHRQQPFGDTISQITSSFYYVHENANIEELAVDLEKNSAAFSICVLDSDFYPVGIILKNELFNKLGKRFGRDVYQRKPSRKLVKKVELIPAQKNIFGVAERLQEALNQHETQYYILVNNNGKYFGIFSTHDLLIYLTSITQTDIDLAKKLQANIVKNEEYIEKEKFCMIGSSRMAKGVGGDFYSVNEYKKKHWLITLCDVSGKGISASLITALIGGMLSIFDFNQELGKFIKKLNQYIFHTFSLEKFVTGLFIDFNVKAGQLKIFDMGHSMGTSNIYLYRKNKFFVLKNKNYNLALGITDQITTLFDCFKLESGDRLLFITDGVLDQRNPENCEYKLESIVKLFHQNKNKSIKALKDKIFSDIIQFKGTNHQQDDITFIILEYKG